MYLNLDLLYNTYKYLFPLFYYGDGFNYYAVYSPITKKVVFFHNSCSYHIDNNHKINYSKFYFTKEYIYWFDTHFYKSSPFKINKEIKSYLKF